MIMRLRRLVIGCSAVLAACGSSPTTPSTPAASTPASVAVKGPAALGIGRTAQFTATTDSGRDVTIDAVWQTSDAAIARFLSGSTGRLTGFTAGTVTVTATFKGVSATTDVLVSPVRLPPTITSCGTIAEPGAYTVAADLFQAAAFGACLQIEADGVQLDCGNHTVSGLLLSHVTGGTVSHCSVLTLGLPGVAASIAEVADSTNVTLTHNAFATMLLIGGHGNSVIENAIDGEYDGSGLHVGQDDGIVLVDEANDTIQGNTIRNVWDAGIEGVDTVANSSIANNTIVNAGYAGIGAYWCTSWTGNTLSHNSISRSVWMVAFVYEVSQAKCLDTATVGGFANNQMVGNRFSSPLPSDGSMAFNFPTLDAGRVSNNLIQGNDLGSQPGPTTVPASGFINGGGNICEPFSSPFCGGLAVRAIHSRYPATRGIAASSGPVARMRPGLRRVQPGLGTIQRPPDF